MSSASRARRRRATVLVTSAVVPCLTACLGSKESSAPPPSPIEVLPQEILTTPVQPDEKIIAQELRAIAGRLAERAGPSGDPRLDGLMAEIELRAAVELAKLEARRGV